MLLGRVASVAHGVDTLAFTALDSFDTRFEVKFDTLALLEGQAAYFVR